MSRSGNVRGIFVSTLLSGALAGCGNQHIGGYFDGGPDTGHPTDQRADVPTVETTPPAVGPGSMLLVPSDALLVGNGPDSCTNQSPPTTDRWCAFSAPSSFLGNHDLWVINVTKALAGTKISCKGSDPNCLRLTTDLFVPISATTMTEDFSIHSFSGDTLVYYAENNGDSTNFVGTAYAWRPDWPAPHAITSQTAFRCQVHPTVPAAICIENVNTDMAQNLNLDLTGGKLTAGGGQLPLLSSILYSAPGDPTDVIKFQVDFSPAGDAAIWSARNTPNGPEVLNWQMLDDPSARKVITDTMAHWQVSADGARWYWLKSFNYSTTGGDSGTLQTAPYPAGAPVTTVAPNIGQYTQVSGKGLVVRANMNKSVGDLKLIGDIGDVAGTTKTLDTGVLQVWDLSADGTTALYSKTNTGQLVDMYLASLSKPMPCALASTPLALGFGHLAENTLTAAWIKVISQTDQGAFYTTFDSCMTRQFATNIATFASVGDQGYVYEDEGSDVAPEATLRFNQMMNGMLKTTGTVVQKRAYPTAAVLWPAHGAVVYSINTGGSTDGLYLNATLPFTGVTPPPGFVPAPTDGGAGDGGTDGTVMGDAPVSDAGKPDLAPVSDGGAGDLPAAPDLAPAPDAGADATGG